MAKLMLVSVSAIALLMMITNHQAAAQIGGRSLYDSTMPPGQIGHMQLLRRTAMRGHLQPVRLLAPEGARVSVFDGGTFQDLGSHDVTVGMLIGSVYRVKVTEIPGHAGLEIFPSVEVINRLYPPPGLELKFPIEVHLDETDLTTAGNGAIVTRIVYLEDPEAAVPEQQQRDHQPYFDVGPGRDPLHVAQQLGRPMAIVRCGGINPDSADLHEFTFGAPPIQLYQLMPTSSADDGRLGQATLFNDFGR